MAILQVIGIIKYANLEFGKYNAWNINMYCKLSILDQIKTFFKTKNPLGNEQVKVVDLEIGISSIEFCVKDQISLIEDRKEKQWIESIYDRKKFLFTYNGIANIHLNPGHDIKEF